jgi:cell division protein FtsN
MVGTGTARVEVRAIDPDTWDNATRMAGTGTSTGTSNSIGTGAAPQQAASQAASEHEATWLQAGAYGRREGAEELAGRLRQADLAPVSINDSDNLFRVWLGPYGSYAEAESVILKAIELGFERPHRVRR